MADQQPPGEPRMIEKPNLHSPWLVAVWPGMGQIAVSAGFYLMAKLQMHLFAEFRPLEHFDVEYVEVKDGLVHTGQLPRSRLFLWSDPEGKHDIVVFIGEAQPPSGKYAFCRKLVDFARQLGVKRLFTFAAMATQMRPEQASRVFGAATDESNLDELRRHDVEILKDAQIGGLNGVLLGVAAQAGMQGACLLGEMPHVFVQLPYPKGALAVLETFAAIARMDLDLFELRQQAEAVEERLHELFGAMEEAMDQQEAGVEQEFAVEEKKAERLDPDDRRRIERLFEQSQQDRSKAYELKGELDRLGVFDEYEDRFLDLFKKPD